MNTTLVLNLNIYNRVSNPGLNSIFLNLLNFKYQTIHFTDLLYFFKLAYIKFNYKQIISLPCITANAGTNLFKHKLKSISNLFYNFMHYLLFIQNSYIQIKFYNFLSHNKTFLGTALRPPRRLFNSFFLKYKIIK
jgi:hypothetical protein